MHVSEEGIILNVNSAWGSTQSTIPVEAFSSIFLINKEGVIVDIGEHLRPYFQETWGSTKAVQK